MMIVLVYCYFNFLLAPLNKQEIKPPTASLPWMPSSRRRTP